MERWYRVYSSAIGVLHGRVIMRNEIKLLLLFLLAGMCFLGCGTTGSRLISNSVGYQADDPNTYHQKGQKPEWINDLNKWIAENGQKDLIYFKASSEPRPSEVRDGQSIDEANQNVFTDVKKQVSTYIRSRVRVSYEEKVTELRKNSDAAAIKAAEELYTREKTYLDSWITSSTSFEGLTLVDYYYEVYEGNNKEKKRIEFVHYWGLYSTPEEKIKGEVWWANLPADPYRSEPGKRRPILIIQNDAFNRSAIQTTICAVITSNMKLARLPANILLEKSVSGLERASVVNFSQIITVDKSRLTEQVSMLPKNYIAKINASIRYIFDAE
ncbi:hypothetical protein FACS1894200_13640 [Spirochaetia bacterium]|nr:hypothetical protein FACS1894200_13640 [Spirochaetia bacterium]